MWKCVCVCGCVAVCVWLCVCVCVCVWLLLCVWLCVGRCLCLVPREAQLVTLLVASCSYLPMVTLTWPGLMTRANRLQYVHRQWVSDGDDRSLEWRPVGYESTQSSGSLLNVGERVPV